MYYFCTFFDRNYLPRALALYASLKEHCPDFQLWALCMDDDAYNVLTQMALPDFRLIRLQDFELGDTGLLKAKENRSRIEYYFTCTASIPIYVLNQAPEVDLITHLDADLFFYADPAPVFREIANHSIAIIPHRFHPRSAHLEVCGTYNVGWFSMRRDANGMACLRWWRERCLEWCYDRLEDGKFADQKYMEQFQQKFQRVIVLQHKGANLAPWSLANYQIRWEGNQVWVDDQPLVFFHFHGLKRLSGRFYDSGLGAYKTRLSKTLATHIFGPYLKQLVRANSAVTKYSGGSFTAQNLRSRTGASLGERLYRRIRRFSRILYQVILPGNYLVAAAEPRESADAG